MIPPEVHFCGVETLAEGMGHIGIWARQAAALQMRQIQRYESRELQIQIHCENLARTKGNEA